MNHPSPGKEQVMTLEDMTIIDDGVISRLTPDNAYHAVCIGKVTHPCGHAQEVVEVVECLADGEHSRRVFDLSTVVHALLNLEADEENK